MRLIDADGMTEGRVENDPVVIAAKCAPTAYDPDKVVEQLEELRELDACDFDDCPVEDIHCCDCTQKRMAERAIEIVKGGGIDER